MCKKCKAESLFKDILLEIGENPEREGLVETPKRYIKFLKEFLSPQEFSFTCFDSEGYDEIVVQKEIPFFSLCEHHVAPFFGLGYIAYIPDKKIVGLSKLARTLEKFSKRLQNQERITKQVGEFLEENLSPKGVAVMLKARHMCIEMRGVEKGNVWTTTSFFSGVFKTNFDKKSEFYSLIK